MKNRYKLDFPSSELEEITKILVLFSIFQIFTLKNLAISKGNCSLHRDSPSHGCLRPISQSRARLQSSKLLTAVRCEHLQTLR